MERVFNVVEEAMCRNGQVGSDNNYRECRRRRCWQQMQSHRCHYRPSNANKTTTTTAINRQRQWPKKCLKLKIAVAKMPPKIFTVGTTPLYFFVLLLLIISQQPPFAFGDKAGHDAQLTKTTTTTTTATVAFHAPFVGTQRSTNLASNGVELMDVLLEEFGDRQRRRNLLQNRNKMKSSWSAESSSSSASLSSSSYEDDADGRHGGVGDGVGRSADDAQFSALSRTARRIILPQQPIHTGKHWLPPHSYHQHANIYHRIDPAHPIHILFPLPAREGPKRQNPFGITILKARPVVDEGVLEVYRRQLLPRNSLITYFNDSKTSDAHGPNVAINMMVQNRVDCIIGYAFVYALAPVARMSPYWRNNGIPVITSIGLTTNLDNREEYKLMTRISSPYKVVRDALYKLFLIMEWAKLAYMFHDERYNSAINIPHGECYLLMVSLVSRMSTLTQMEHNHFGFNELNYEYQKLRDNLKKASMLANV